MTTYDAGIFGIEYVLMLGAWYAVALVLALLAAGLRHALAYRGRMGAGDPAPTGTTAHTGL